MLSLALPFLMYSIRLFSVRRCGYLLLLIDESTEMCLRCLSWSILEIRCPSERNRGWPFEDQDYTRDGTSDPSETTNESHGQDILHSLIYSKPLEESQAPVSSNEKRCRVCVVRRMPEGFPSDEERALVSASLDGGSIINYLSTSTGKSSVPHSKTGDSNKAHRAAPSIPSYDFFPYL